MMRIFLIVCGLALAAFAVLIPLTGQWRAQPQQVTFMQQVLTSEQIARGRVLYDQTCASCHGANLEGQPDWKQRLDNGKMPAPPHDASGHTWHHSDSQLFTITKWGLGAVVEGYDSDMPAFDGILTDEEIRAVLGFIKSTWPARERRYQDDISTADAAG